MHLKMPASAEVVCCIYLLTLFTIVSEEANRLDPDETASTFLNPLQTNGVFNPVSLSDITKFGWFIKYIQGHLLQFPHSFIFQSLKIFFI